MQIVLPWEQSAPPMRRAVRHIAATSAIQSVATRLSVSIRFTPKEMLSNGIGSEGDEESVVYKQQTQQQHQTN